MSKQSFKLKSMPEAEDWFQANPGRSVTCEKGDDSVNISSLEEAKIFFGDKPKKGNPKKSEE